MSSLPGIRRVPSLAVRKLLDRTLTASELHMRALLLLYLDHRGCGARAAKWLAQQAVNTPEEFAVAALSVFDATCDAGVRRALIDGLRRSQRDHGWYCR